MTTEQIRSNITSNVQQHLATKRHNLIVSRLRLAGFIALMVVFGAAALISLLLFVEQSRIAGLFNPYIGASFVGYVWMWFPELLAISIVSVILLNLVGGIAQLPTKPILQITTLAYIVIALVGIWSTPLTSTIAQNDYYNSVATSEYRSGWRDGYVEVLENKNEFFGVVSDKDCDMGTISIDHGGVVKRLIINLDDCTLIPTGSLTWVKLNSNNVEIIAFEIVYLT